jgi:hypothetical protein
MAYQNTAFDIGKISIWNRTGPITLMNPDCDPARYALEFIGIFV